MSNTRTFNLQVKEYCKIETMLTQSVVIYKTPAFLTYFLHLLYLEKLGRLQAHLLQHRLLPLTVPSGR